MPFDLSDPNVFSPSEMGWSGAANAAAGLLPSQTDEGYKMPYTLPIGILAGAGLGMLSSKKHRLRNTLLGGLGGGLAATGATALAGGMEGRHNSELLRNWAADAAVNGTTSDVHNSSEYLKDLYQTKMPKAPGWSASSDAARIGKELNGWIDPRRFTGSREASGHAAAGRRQYVLDQLDHVRLPASKYSPEEAGLATINASPDLLSQWPSENIAAATNKHFAP